MPTSQLTLTSLPGPSESKIVSAPSLHLNLPQPAKRFFRHGWQSWSLTTWLDPDSPPLPIRAPEFRLKDEDPGYALSKNHVSAWVAAVELGEDDILLLSSLDLGGRVELDGSSLKGFFEDNHTGEWLLARGREEEVFSKYAELLKTKFGMRRWENAPRVWCSWYSLYKWVTERLFLDALRDFDNMPFDVFQLDDGWQLDYGDWEPNKKFASGMKAIAQKISATGRTPGIWLAPFMVSPRSKLIREHPDWLLRDEHGAPVRVGITWSGNLYGLDSSHPQVLEWLAQLIRHVRAWGYEYLKLDFLYIGALIGKRYEHLPREAAYRRAMQVMREAAGNAFILACGAPIIPSLGLCDGMRVGPDVAPFWLNKPLAVWLNNPNDVSTQNAIRTSLHRLWLSPLVHVDPDVSFFRSRYNALRQHEKQMLQDLAVISDFKATSDLPQWLDPSERKALTAFLETNARVQKLNRYEYQIDHRRVDFRPALPIRSSTKNIPVLLAKYLGLLKIAAYQALPAIMENWHL